MNRAQKMLAGLLGVVVAELAVVDYAAMEFLRNGFQMEVDLTELEKAEYFYFYVEPGETRLDGIGMPVPDVVIETEYKDNILLWKLED